MKLHFRKFGEGEPVLILHGLFGSSDNWQTIGKQLASDYEVYLIDQRNHGKSGHSDEFSYQDLADDLLEFVRDHQITGCNLIGHSMGAKTVMTFAQQWEEFVYKMIVADMGVRKYASHNDDVIAALQSVDFAVHDSRKKVAEVISSQLKDPSVVQFLLKNLFWKEKGKLGWKMNLDALVENMPGILTALDSKQCHTDTLFLSGGASDYVHENDHAEIRAIFPNARFDSIPVAGHWLHADNPVTFLQKILVYLDE